MGTFTTLAEQALHHAKALDAYLVSQNEGPASFERENFASLPSSLAIHREGLIDTSQTLKQLAQGPSGILIEATWACADETSLGVIYDRQLAKKVPSEGTATYAEIAEASGLDKGLVERILRHAMTMRIFTEEPPGHVCHTAASRQLATDPDADDMLGMTTQEMWPAAGKMTEAMSRYGNSQEAGETAFGLAHDDPGVPMFEHLAKYPERVRRVAGAMRYWGKSDRFSIKYSVDGWDWSRFDKEGSTMVDIGGGTGAATIAIAKATKHMKFIVQDVAGNAQDGPKVLPASLKGRVDFMEHDLFEKQRVEGAQVYFLRWILHDWSDKYALKILRSLVPAMRPGSRIVLYEWLLADGPETRWTEKQSRNSDLVMLGLFNGRERSAKAFEDMFHECDPRFEVKSAQKLDGSGLSMLEAIWKS